VRARLISLTSMAAAVAVLAPMAPASALPSVTGEYSTATLTVSTFIKSDECRDVLSVKWTVDLQGIGNAVQAQGYTNYSDKSQPVYTNTEWGSWLHRHRPEQLLLQLRQVRTGLPDQ
jgi:hypothetical protein